MPRPIEIFLKGTDGDPSKADFLTEGLSEPHPYCLRFGKVFCVPRLESSYKQKSPDLTRIRESLQRKEFPVFESGRMMPDQGIFESLHRQIQRNKVKKR